MKALIHFGAFVLLVVLLVGNLETTKGDPITGQQNAEIQRAKFSIPKLFDFELYKKLFRKSYSSLMEHMMRAKYFMSRSIRAFISATRYSHGDQDYFLAVNHMSDFAESELNQMRNRALDERAAARRAQAPSQEEESAAEIDPIPELSLQEGQEAFESLVESLKARQADPFYAELLETIRSMAQTGSSINSDKLANLLGKGQEIDAEIAEQLSKLKRPDRTKREVSGSSELSKKPKPRRSLPLNKLINLGSSEHLSAKARRKIPSRPKGNNPLYEPPELTAMGMVDQQVPVEMLRMKGGQSQRAKLTTAKSPALNKIILKDNDLDSFLDKLKRPFIQQRQTGELGNTGVAPEDEKVDLPDEVFVDLRDSDCLFLPRNQGTCGSCYAFAATALMEYLYCKKTGQLVAFSEQYLVDCGKDHYKNSIFGCAGGISEDMPGYFHNFGVELRSLYPYRMREDTCPYEEDYDLRHAGFIRTDVKLAWEVPLSRFAEILKFSPILVNVQLAKDFSEYGGGVHPNLCQKNDAFHAMLIIGHGRQDNQEYWLVRNSNSVGWGEGGYYKLAKSTRCIDERRGWIFGSSNGKGLDLDVMPNHRHDEELIQDHYFKSLA